MTEARKMAAAAAVVVVGGLGLFVGSATADPPTATVPAHQHYVVNGHDDLVRVGPNACLNGMSHQFDNFHRNGHLGRPGQRGVIVGRACSFVP